MSLRYVIVVFAIAVGLTVLFWTPLWQGDGLVGGDLYTYFFPQKVFYATELAEGRIPFWNNQVAFGYPMLAESQTGVLYPPNLLLYRYLEVNTAYNASQIGHYVLAFVFTWLLLRKLNLSATAALLGAIILVYGWFPERICLEWAIIGGVYFPLALLCVESFLQSGRRRWLVLLALSQAVHLLAGHFTLAFITQLTCVAYAGLRALVRDVDRSSQSDSSPRRRPNALVALILVSVAIGIGFSLAAVQVLPSWELKKNSQRENLGGPFDPGYGNIPPWYLTQIIAPWYWYPSDVNPDDTLWTVNTWTIPASTNKVEAHLYFGMIPLLLIGYRLVVTRRGAPLDRRHRLWLWLGLAAMVYSTGWLLPLTRHLPGFSFFMGPGRYGMVTTFAAALLAGAGLDHFLKRPHDRFRGLLVGLVFALTIVDLYWVSRRVTYAVMVENPPVAHAEESPVRKELLKYEATHGPERTVRMLAQGPNIATLTGFAAYPQYLGIGPAAYFDSRYKMPELTNDLTIFDRFKTLEAGRVWCREGAISHILTMQPIDTNEWPTVTFVWRGIDRMLNRLYAHPDPLLLYELQDSLPRVSLEGEGTFKITSLSPSQLIAEVTTENGGRLTWAELAYPGWTARVTNEFGTVTEETKSGFLRKMGVPPGDSTVVWTYEPLSIRVGILLSLATLIAVCVMCVYWLIRRRPAGSPPDSSPSE